MRLLLGLLLSLAVIARPAGADPKEKEHKKTSRQEEKVERKQPAEEKPAAPAGRPAATEVAVPPPKVRPARARARAPKRRAAAAPAPTVAPAAAPAVGPAEPPTAPPAAAPTAAPLAAVPAAAPAQRRPPRRRARPRRPRHAVLGFRAAGSRAARSAPVLATVTATLPATAIRAGGIARRRTPVATPRRDVIKERPPPAAAVVTRVINVIPPPLRIAFFGLAALVGLLALRARRLEHQRQDLSDDLGLLQSALLPQLPARIGDAWISAAYRPAEGLAAGGDFYDAFALDAARTCLLVGDVAGHGRDAIPLTADVRFTLRAYLEAGLAPRAALRATAEVLEPRLGGRFVTVVVAIYDARNGRLTYASAGHPPPLLAGVEERLLTASGCPAIGTGLPTGRRETTVALPPGATACFYTDGLTDTKAAERRVGPAELARHLLALGPRGDARTLLERLVRATDAQPDDMAACLLRPRLGAAAGPAGRVEELEIDDVDDGRARRFLLACDVPEAEADAALAAARDLVPVVLTVSCTPRGGAVAVHRPDSVALPLASA